ncbi:MAG: hypothetical protein Hyperionvirus4_133 [Hyperionvirus sp.]|uniref:Uncharacterized protein n=1 Tax=Hyperionvirus sp. TaxID=2487770 RepID=A0A3G5A7L7_9VIRU|nr:MAG: hypothetical protein Hyperionvirus4_133 [Hyperionvirus sp.]
MDPESSFIQLLASIEKCMIRPFEVSLEDNDNIITNMEQLLDAENIKLFRFLNEKSDNAYAAKLIGNFYEIKYDEGKMSDIAARTEASKWFRKSAEMGQPIALTKIGLDHMKGEYGEKNYQLAMEFFKKAADKKHPDAMFNIGEMYYYGHGIPISLPDAFNWYLNAAKLGDIAGVLSVAYMYLNGEAVDKSCTEGLKWSHEAAKMGDPMGMCNIADLYNGTYPDFTPTDKKVAMEWYLKAANLGSAYAMRVLGNTHYEKDQKQSLEWYKKSSDVEPDDSIMYSIGQMYEFDIGCTASLSESLLWYARSAALNNARAMNKMGTYYFYGWAVTPDYNAAFSWYMKAAQLKDAEGIANVGYMYYHGLGCIQDKKKAFKWLLKSLDKKYSHACHELGVFYKNAYLETKTGSQEIIKTYEKGAELGNIEAMLELGDLYQKGVYTEKDEKLALKWYHEAANNKNHTALTKIGEIYEDQKNIDQAIKYFARSLQKITDKAEAERMKKKITKLMDTNNIDLLIEWIKLVDEKAEKANKIPEAVTDKKKEVLHQPEGDGYILC